MKPFKRSAILDLRVVVENMSRRTSQCAEHFSNLKQQVSGFSGTPHQEKGTASDDPLTKKQRKTAVVAPTFTSPLAETYRGSVVNRSRENFEALETDTKDLLGKGRKCTKLKKLGGTVGYKFSGKLFNGGPDQGNQGNPGVQCDIRDFTVSGLNYETTNEKKTNKIVKCLKCGEHFQSVADLSHHNCFFFRCSYCDYSFKELCVLRHHMADKHPEKEAARSKREESTASYSMSIRENKVQCKFCSCDFAKNDYVKHKEACGKRKKFKCSSCSAVYFSKYVKKFCQKCSRSERIRFSSIESSSTTPTRQNPSAKVSEIADKSKSNSSNGKSQRTVLATEIADKSKSSSNGKSQRTVLANGQRKKGPGNYGTVSGPSSSKSRPDGSGDRRRNAAAASELSSGRILSEGSDCEHWSRKRGPSNDKPGPSQSRADKRFKKQHHQSHLEEPPVAAAEAASNSMVAVCSEINKLPKNSAIFVFQEPQFYACVRCGYLNASYLEGVEHYVDCKSDVKNRSVLVKNLRWVCLTCITAYKTVSELVKHKSECESPDESDDDSCSSDTETKNKLVSKLKIEHNMNRHYWCHRCGHGFTSHFTLEEHPCEKWIKSMSSCTVSIKKLPSGSQAACGRFSTVRVCSRRQCGKIFTDVRNYQKHLRQHRPRAAGTTRSGNSDNIEKNPQNSGGLLLRKVKQEKIDHQSVPCKVPDPEVSSANYAAGACTETSSITPLPVTHHVLPPTPTNSTANSSFSDADVSACNSNDPDHYKCRACGETFERMFDFDFHANMKHRSLSTKYAGRAPHSLQCLSCGREFPSPLPLALHVCPAGGSIFSGRIVDQRSSLFQSLSSILRSWEKADALRSASQPGHLNGMIVPPSLPNGISVGQPCMQVTDVHSSQQPQAVKEPFPRIHNVHSLANIKPSTVTGGPSIEKVTAPEEGTDCASDNDFDLPDAWALQCGSLSDEEAENDEKLGETASTSSVARHYICRCYQSFTDKSEFSAHCATEHKILEKKFKIHIFGDSDSDNS